MNNLKKHKIIILNIFIILLVAFAIIWAICTYFGLDDKAYTNDAQIEEYINPINTRIPGYIIEVRFSEHQHVKKGDTLVLLDDSEYKIQLQQAEAAYLSALASKEVASSSVNTIRNSISISEANLKASEARLWNSKENYRRYENLLKEGAATQQQFDQVKSEYEAMLSQTKSLANQRQASKFSTNESSKKILVNDAEIKRAEAAVAMARLNLSYTIIKAPYDGVTGRRSIQEGQLLQAGQNLLSFVRNQNKWVVANYKETQIENLNIGQKMLIKIDGIRNKEFIGKITAISQATGSRYSGVPVDNSAGNFVKVQQRIPVKIEFVAAENDTQELEKLRAGMNVEISKIN